MSWLGEQTTLSYPQQADALLEEVEGAELQPHPASPSAFFSSSSLQHASALVVGAPPQHPVVAASTGFSFFTFSNVSI